MHGIKRCRHPRRKCLVNPRLAAHYKVLTVEVLPIRKCLGKRQAVASPLVKRIKRHRKPQCR